MESERRGHAVNGGDGGGGMREERVEVVYGVIVDYSSRC